MIGVWLFAGFSTAALYAEMDDHCDITVALHASLFLGDPPLDHTLEGMVQCGGWHDDAVMFAYVTVIMMVAVAGLAAISLADAAWQRYRRVPA